MEEEVNETKFLELREGEQLSKEDIERAMDHPDVRPSSLYAVEEESVSKHQPSFQLYFGPGFEKRLEMEIEECVLIGVLYQCQLDASILDSPNPMSSHLSGPC